MQRAARAACCAVVVLVAACGKERGAQAARDSADAGAPVESTMAMPAQAAPLDTVGVTFVAWAVDALALVDTNANLSTWRARNPRDSIGRFTRRQTRRYPNTSSDEFPLGTWCARATARASFANGQTALRRVYFYPTALAPGATLPTPEDAARFMATECRVGLVFIQLLEADGERGRGLAWVLRRDLEERYGTGAPPAQQNAAFSGPRGKSWLVGPRGLGVAYLEYHGARGTDGAPGAWNTTDEDWRGVVALAYRSHPSIGDDHVARLDEEDEPPTQDPAAMLRLGLETANVDPMTSAQLRTLLASLTVAEPPQGGARPFVLDSFAPLAPWLAAAGGLPPERQAGALFAADVVLQLASRRGLLPTDSISRARLETLGAALAYSGVEKRHYYGGALRRSAFELHASGQVGDTLFSLHVRHAEPCTPLGWIIAEAERHAGSSRVAAMRTAARLVAARALADSFVYTGSDALRQLALERYQTVLTEAQYDRDAQQRAWQEGWRLAVGLAPLRLRYYCSRPD